MAHLLFSDQSRYTCLEEASRRYPSLDPSACEAYLSLLRTSAAVSEIRGAFLARHQISEGRFTVLMLLNSVADEPRSPADLAEMGDVSRATISGVLDTLERDGLVTRADDPDDRRGILVRLTATGKALIEQICPGFFTRVADMMQPLNPAERGQLVKLLQKIQSGLGESTGV